MRGTCLLVFGRGVPSVTMPLPPTHPTPPSLMRPPPSSPPSTQVRLRQWQLAVASVTKCLDRERQQGDGGGIESLTTDVEAWMVMAK